LLSKQINDRPNGFIRLTPPQLIMPLSHLDTKCNSFYIAGVNSLGIYLGNYNTPWELNRVDYKLQNVQTFKIKWMDSVKIFRGAKIEVDSPFVYLKDGIGAKFIINELSTLKNKDMEIVPYFSQLIAFNSKSLILRVVNKKKENVIIKLFPRSKTIKEGVSLLQKQGDGLFSTDGIFIKIPKKGKVIYVYYYRNQFFLADSNLNLLYRGRTIDTINNVQIKVKHLEYDNQLTISSPPLIVNKRACANERYLFVNSALYANNELTKYLDKVSIIDVYSIESGKYKFSFYLPDFGGIKMTEFKVFGKTLVALYGKYIYTYRLNF